MRKEQSKLASSFMMKFDFEGRLFMQEKLMGDDGGVQGLEKMEEWSIIASKPIWRENGAPIISADGLIWSRR